MAIIDLPTTITDELTLAMVRRQLPRGLGILVLQKARPAYRVWFLGPCVRAPAFDRFHPRSYTFHVHGPASTDMCEHCVRYAAGHPTPEYIEHRDYDRLVIVHDNGNTFRLRL